MTRRIATTGNEGWRTSPRPPATDADRLYVHGPLHPANDNPRRGTIRVALLAAAVLWLGWFAAWAVFQ